MPVRRHSLMPMASSGIQAIPSAPMLGCSCLSLKEPLLVHFYRNIGFDAVFLEEDAPQVNEAVLSATLAHGLEITLYRAAPRPEVAQAMGDEGELVFGAL